MKSRTRQRLHRINVDFYREHADEFDRTRRRPWSGWGRVVGRVLQSGRRRVTVLDLGCGNGRFASFLDDYGVSFDYLGIDASAGLLAASRERLRSTAGCESAELLEADLLDTPLADVVGDRRFDLIVAFGLLHHLPSLAARRRLLASLDRHLTPDGTAAISFWQFGADERFRHRRVSWRTFNAAVEEPIDESELEPGDHLLAWGAAEGVVRYCHWTSPEEAHELLAAAGLEIVETYAADGRSGALNLYALARPAGASIAVRSSRDAGSR